MKKNIEEIYSYTEDSNPYANGETISVSLIKDANYNRYVEIAVSNDVTDGCSIFLTEEQIKEIVNQLNLIFD